MAANNVWDIWQPNTPSPSNPSAVQSPQQWSAGQGNPFYNGGNYGQTSDWYNSPIGENIREQNQQLAFGSWGQRQGIAQTDNAFNQWFYKTQFPRFQQAYGMATMDNPMLTIDQFLATMPTYTQLQNEYSAQSPLARGSNYAQYSPNVRWIPR